MIKTITISEDADTLDEGWGASENETCYHCKKTFLPDEKVHELIVWNSEDDGDEDDWCFIHHDCIPLVSMVIDDCYEE